MGIQILPKTFFPPLEQDRFKHRGDALGARKSFEKNKPPNLNYLLKKRYEWMNEFIKHDDICIELGAGPGLGSFYYKHNVLITDIEKHPWVNMQVDALNLPFEDNSVDVFICSHMIHHLSHPKRFFTTLGKKLNKGGYVLIQEVETSILMKIMLILTKHEGYSDEINVFEEEEICNDHSDPWSANCAIPKLLFDNEKIFSNQIKNFKILKNIKNEFFIFVLSGGVIVRTQTINLPVSILKLIDSIDKLLIKIAPNIFALGRSVVLQKF